MKGYGQLNALRCLINGWLKKTGKINGGTGDEGLQEGEKAEQNREMNSAGCEISRQIEIPLPLQHLQIENQKSYEKTYL